MNSKKLLELRDKRGVLLDKIDEIRAAKDEKGEARNLTDEERSTIAEHFSAIDQLDLDIKDAEIEARAEAAKLDKQIRNQIPGDRKVATESRKSYHSWPQEEAGEFLRAVAGVSSGARQIPSDIHEDLRETFIAQMEYRAPTGQGTLVPQEGGFAVPSTVQAGFLSKMHTEGQILQRVRNVPITVGNSTEFNAITENARTSGSRYGGVAVARTAEGIAAAASKVKIDRIKLALKKLTAANYMTEEQLADGPQMRSIVEENVPAAIRFTIEDEIINGNGGPNMDGILNANCTVSVAKESGQAAATVLYENIVKMYSRMFAPSRSNAVWLINQDIEPQLFTMSLAVGTGGVPVYIPANGAAGSPYGTLMGRPVVPIEHAATLGTVGDIALVDLSQYLYATGGGLATSQSMHVKFLEGETAFRWVLRNDGKPWWSAPLTPAKGSNTLSPFVTLATRA